MKYPTIHLNGTSASALYEQTVRAYDAVRAAMIAVGDACPNGRDYYPQGPHALSEALTEHDQRLLRLKSVMEELEDMAAHIADVRCESGPSEGVDARSLS